MLISLFILLVMVVAAVGAPWLAPYSPRKMDIAHRLAAPSAAHWFGTDEFGRDVLTRCMYGAQLSLTVGLLVVFVSLTCGTVLGVVSGYVRRLDGLLMRVTDALMAFPDILLAIALMAALGASLTDVVIALSTVYTPRVARVARGATLVLRELQFIEAAEALGASSRRVIVVHLLPNLLSPLLVQGTFVFAFSILTEAALSFLGAGVPPTSPTWGNMIATAQEYMQNAALADPRPRPLHRADRAVAAGGGRRPARRTRSEAAPADMSDAAAARGRGPANLLPRRGHRRARRRWRQLHRRRRRNAGDRGRVRQRQIGDLALHHAPGADTARRDRRRSRAVPRPRPAALCRSRRCGTSAATRSA